MILGVSLERAIEILRTKGCTSGPMLSKVLNDRGFNIPREQTRLPKNRRIFRDQKYSQYVPNRCIAKVRSEGVKKCHWILFWDRKEYDPYPGRVPWQYISGYLEIKTA
jgi:hypothetical protein